MGRAMSPVRLVPNPRRGRHSPIPETMRLSGTRGEKSRRRGYTLVEAVVTLTATALMLTGLTSSLMMIMRANMHLDYDAIMRVQSDRALQTLDNDAGQASSVESASADTFTILVPMPGTPTSSVYDNVAMETDEIEYTYRRHLRDLVRVKNAGTANEEETVLLEGIEFLQLAYSDMQGGSTMTPLDVKEIHLEASISRGTHSLAKRYLDLSSSIFLRNRLSSN